MSNKKPKRPYNSPLHVRHTPFEKEAFINNVCNDRYVLVIGSEVVLDKEKHADVNGDVLAFILKVLNNILGKREKPYKTLNALVASRPSISTERELSGADLIRNILIPNDNDEDYDEEEYEVDDEYYNDEEGDVISLDESEREENYSISVNDLSPELCNLLNTRLFRFVMTTTFDSNVEFIMRTIWGSELRVVNIADQDDWKKFQLEIGSTIDRTNISRTVYKYNRPTLIYIFGKATTDRSKNFVKTENDAIEFIELWMNRQEPITNMLKERRILALGCKFEDWYFRFFWYILKRDFGRMGEGEVALSLDDEEPNDQNLKKFLKRKDIYVHKDARQFMRNLYDMLNPKENNAMSMAFHEIMKKRRGDGEIFLSYCSRDFILASRIFFKLTDLGYNVWFDNEELCGGDYEKDIRDAINKARVVITLLTPNVADDLKNNDTQHFYNKEWRFASQTGCERLVPLAADGYSLRACYHARQEGDGSKLTTYEEIIGGHRNGVDLMADNFSKLIEIINNIK